MKKKLPNKAINKTEKVNLTVLDDKKFIGALQKSEARKLNLKLWLNNYYTTKK